MPVGPAEGKMRFIDDLLRDCRGATAIEYGLIVALIMIAAVGAIGSVAGSTVNMWNDVATRFAQG